MDNDLWRWLKALHWFPKVVIAAIAIVALISVIGNLSPDEDGATSAAPQRSIPTAEPRPLESLMRINDGGKCTPDEATGRVTNNSTMTVKLFIEIQFLDSAGVVIDSSNAWVRGLRPGETGEWDAPYLGSRSYSNCRAQVTSAFEH